MRESLVPISVGTVETNALLGVELRNIIQAAFSAANNNLIHVAKSGFELDQIDNLSIYTSA